MLGTDHWTWLLSVQSCRGEGSVSCIMLFFVWMLTSVFLVSQYFIYRSVANSWYFAVPSLLSIVTVLQTSNEMAIITHEVKLGLVKPMEYIAARGLIELPWMGEMN